MFTLFTVILSSPFVCMSLHLSELTENILITIILLIGETKITSPLTVSTGFCVRPGQRVYKPER